MIKQETSNLEEQIQKSMHKQSSLENLKTQDMSQLMAQYRQKQVFLQNEAGMELMVPNPQQAIPQKQSEHFNKIEQVISSINEIIQRVIIGFGREINQFSISFLAEYYFYFSIYILIIY